MRGAFEHNGSVASLEDWFDPSRLKDTDSSCQGTPIRAAIVVGRKESITRIP